MDRVKRISREEEFKKNKELKEEDLEHLKDWYRKQPHFPKYLDEIGLILFFHSNFYRIEPTKVTIDNFLTCRTHMPEFFSKKDPVTQKNLRQIMKTVLVLPLELKAKNYGVFYSRLLNFDPDKFTFYDGIRLYAMIMELWLLKTGTVSGHVFVVDVQGTQMAHVLRVPPMAIKKFLYYLQEAVPLRIKAIHFLNTNSVMDFIMGIIKPLIKKDLMEMIHLHQNTASLSKYVPIDILPNESGGKAGPMMELYGKVLKEIEDNRDYFLEEEKVMKIDESRRPGKPKTATDIFGVEGSFKKLDID